METDKLKWCRDHAPKALQDADDSVLLELMGDMYEQTHTHTDLYDVSKCRPIGLLTTSKGNQRKWYDDCNKCYVKEQFFYQNTYWDDYKVEWLSSVLAAKLNTVDVDIVNQRIVHLGDHYGVVSADFTKHGEYFVSIQRLLQNSGLEYSSADFPYNNFNKICDLVQASCGLDITNYLLVMCVMDYILLNEDRHLNNFGVLRDSEGHYRIAPLFDFGLGLFQHDKRYAGKDLKTAYAYVDGKPFHADMSVIVQTLAKKGYKDKIRTILNGMTSFDVSAIEDHKAQEHVDNALRVLNRLCG